MNLLLMASGKVGADIARWLFCEYPRDLGLVVTTKKDEIFDAAEQLTLPVVTFESSQQLVDELARRHLCPELGLLAWWPMLVKAPLLNATTHGFINTHPSLLPHNRGKHYNFWALVEQVPFGVSLHFIDDGIDTGDVIAQIPISYDWEDTGGSLYTKAAAATVELFKQTYPSIRQLKFKRVQQAFGEGSFHRASELDVASHIELDKTYCARNLLNLLRARTFPGHPACSFSDGDTEFEVRVEIKRKA
jgi:methionyl-tRNA formyltransferase